MNEGHNREMDAERLAFCKAADALLLKSLDADQSFAQAVEGFHQLEAEFVARAGDNEFDVLETKRSIAETILRLTQDKRPPLEVCRAAWNDLVRLGFTNIERECLMAWLYADCCVYDERPDEGLAVIQPPIAKLEQGLEKAKAPGAETGDPAYSYEYWIKRLGNLRDVLEAQKRGEVIPERETRRGDEAAAD